MLNWRVNGNIIEFEYNEQTIFFRFPESVTLPPRPVLGLCEWLMLSPWHDFAAPPDEIETPMQPLDTTALAFSAGVDSAAALAVLPGDTVAVYIRRTGTGKTMLDQTAHLAFARRIDGVIVETNYELIRTTHGLPVGYPTGRAMAVPVLLWAAQHGITGIAFGAVMDDNMFPRGIWQPLTRAYYERQRRFRAAGFECIEPVLGCSEVVTTQIVDRSEYARYARSCLRGGGKPCGNCFKCYRKTMLRGGNPQWNRETAIALEKDPPKMAGPMIYAMQAAQRDVRYMEYARHLDVSWMSRYYRDITPALRANYIQERLQLEYGIKPMSDIDVKAMEATDFRRPAE